jgi:hypothetical protein
MTDVKPNTQYPPSLGRPTMGDHEDAQRLATAYGTSVCFACGGPVTECDCGGEGSSDEEVTHMTAYACTFTFHGDDRLDALEARVSAALEEEDLDFDPQTVTVSRYRLFVNDQSTVMVELWPTGVHVSTREDPSHTWGPPTTLTEEVVR